MKRSVHLELFATMRLFTCLWKTSLSHWLYASHRLIRRSLRLWA